MKRGNHRTRKALNQDNRRRRSAFSSQTADYYGNYMRDARKRGERKQRSFIQKMLGER